MIVKMNYLNNDGVMETVDVYRYFDDNIDYCECFTEERGWFAVSVKKLFPLYDCPYCTVHTCSNGFRVTDINGESIFIANPNYDIPNK